MFSLSPLNVTALSRISMNIDNSTETLRLSKISLYHIKTTSLWMFIQPQTWIVFVEDMFSPAALALPLSSGHWLKPWCCVLCLTILHNLLGNLFSLLELSDILWTQSWHQQTRRLWRLPGREDEVLWSLSLNAGEAGEGDDAGKGQTPAGVHQPSVLPDVSLDAFHEDKQGDDRGRNDQLDHQDAVDSLDEGSPLRLVGLFRF